MRQWLVLTSATVLAAVLASTAPATVRITKQPGRVSRGDSASVTVAVSQKARCTIGVYYSTTKSGARGLGPKTAKTITWTWTVGSTTKTGRWPIRGAGRRPNMRLARKRCDAAASALVPVHSGWSLVRRDALRLARKPAAKIGPRS